MFAQRTPKGAQRGRDLRDRDVSPIKPSPRAHSTNNSYYGNSIVPSGSGSGNVKVVCRVRPCNQKELDLGGSVAVNIEDEKTISVKSSQYNDIGGNGLNFAFDRIFDMESTQEEIYDFTARPVVESVLEGFNGTVFAYGQTSSGKTYTMMGPDLENPEFSGIIPRMVSTVFDYISDTPDHIEFTVKVSMIEIYMERIRDLLNPKKVNLKIREDKSKGIYIEDVTESYVSDERDVYDFLKYGHNNRTTTTTNMNETSSRSHCLFMMTIHQNNLLEMHAKTGKLCLVDLAGSEKVAKTGAVGQVLEEAKEINKSLSALGNVINALTDSRGLMHIPYRDSKLTRILQESLGGNARTSLIINCSPSSYNENETISALRFGYRAKSIKNTPKINREYTAAQLQVLLEKAEKKIVIKDKRIKVLEEILYEHDIDVPGEVLNTEIQPSPNKRRDNSYLETEEGYDGLSDNESCIRADILSPFKNNKADQQEKIKALEDELRIERLSLQKQTDKVRLLKKDLDEANSRMFMVEKENEAFINKLAAQALKIQELQEKLRDKEMKLEILQLLKDILTTENEELKKSRKSFLNDLDEENKEVLKLAQTEGLLFTPRKGADQKGRNTGFITTEDFERRRDAYFGVIDNVTRDMIKEMTQKFSIRNLQTLKEVTIPYMDKLKLAFEGQEETPKKSKEGGSEIKKKYEKLKEELAHEKQKSSKNRHEYEAFLREHDYLDKSMVPSFDEWRQGIGLDSLREESDKDETLSFKDFSTKSAKEQKLALNLEHFKEKKKLSKLAEGNTELLSRLDKTPKGRRDHDEGEPKSPLKTQRMINLEKQLHETKELVNQYKNKIESLKSMISTNPGPSTGSPSSKLDSTEKIENTETFRLQKQNIKQEIVTQVTEKERVFEEGHGELSPKSSVKIVKPIKGGQMKKGSIASQKFFDILKQQYRFNRNFVNGISGESILSKQKQPEKGSKPQSEGKLKGV